MHRYLKFLVVLFVATVFCKGHGQEKRTLLHGEVKSYENDVSSILIVNINSKKSTITDSLGLFTIEVKLMDSLRISAIQYVTKKLVITDTILKENFVVINVVENIIDLNEVTVTPYNLTGKIERDIERLGIKPAVTSASLGLPNATLEVMPQSERLLIEADRGKYVYFGLGFTINTHKILNRLSGRTKSFEDMVARDKIMKLEKELIAKFSKKSMSQNFDIPETRIDGFLSYCMSQKDFSALSEAGSSVEMWDYLKARSIEFKKTDLPQE